ncbi:hypothetical protein, partial [Shimia litoralis]|uniref:hypothetical protein n=1 Tax=Shimia litoralis TaxID=420403 RepID=UPI001BB1C63C
PVARQAHNLKVVGSNPTPATNNTIQYQTLSSQVKHWGIMRARLHQRHINTAPEKLHSPALACIGLHSRAFNCPKMAVWDL